MSTATIQRGPFDAKDWLQYFEKNRQQRQPIAWETGIFVEKELHEPLLRSLQRFQVGEQGDGLHLLKGASRIQNPDYQAAIDLFIKEEQEHSRLLAGAIKGMGGSLLQDHWSDTCFVFLRRLLGLRLELLVLLVAEVIAQVYYKALFEGTTDEVLRAIFAQILQDEDGHVAFHCSYLHQNFAQFSPFTRWLIYIGWRCFFQAVCILVFCDHYALFHAVGMASRTYWHACMQAFHATRIFAYHETCL